MMRIVRANGVGGLWGLGLLGCGGGEGDTAVDCSRQTGTLSVAIWGTWGAPYEAATDIRIEPEGEESYLVSVASASVELEMPAGRYSISMDENSPACLSFESVTAHVRPCGDHEVTLEVDCAF